MLDFDEPMILAVAPNGARKTKADHAAIPISTDEIIREAVACRDAGASLIHLHVRGPDGAHTLDPKTYRQTTDALRDAVGDDLVVQITSEAVGRYSPEEQISVVREIIPEAVSLAVRELCPDPAYEKPMAEFTGWMLDEGVSPQYILYAPDDVCAFLRLCDRGIIKGENAFVLFVLGRYGHGDESRAVDLIPFVQELGSADVRWAVCAFGANELSCAACAMTLGGHVRVGFENNQTMPNGQCLDSNACSVKAVATLAGLTGRDIADARTTRRLLGLR